MSTPNNYVFILGAGASKDANAPLMNGFLQAAEDVERLLERGDRAHEAFEVVRRGRAALQRVHSKAKFDLHNLESVFAAFEMAELMGELPGLAPEDTDQLLAAMRTVITTTLDNRMTFKVIDGFVQAHDEYFYLGKLVQQARKRGDSVTIITFNYDLGVEMGLFANGLHAHYGLGEAGPGPDEVELLKLHGSLNWARCSKTGAHVQPWQMHDIIGDIERERRASQRATSTSISLQVGRGLCRLVHCDNKCLAEPVVVPPTANKAGFHKELQPVWKRAAAKLREADNIAVFGYSWPRGDHFFHQLYALGTASDRILRRFTVYDPDPSVRERFRTELLGEQAASRFAPDDRESLDREQMKFKLAIQHYAKKLKLPIRSVEYRPGSERDTNGR